LLISLGAVIMVLILFICVVTFLNHFCRLPVPSLGWGAGLSTSLLSTFQVLGELNKDLDKMHRSSKQRLDLLKMEICPCRQEVSEEIQGLDYLSGL
jgi:hypothetical protein